MNGFNARLKRAAVKTCAIISACLWCCLICACDDAYIKNGNAINKGGGFSVHYLDVGNGDAIFINFADGKTMLIDCGDKNEQNLKTIKQYIDAYATDGTLNYFVLTHPDSDHVGNAENIIKDYKVQTAYIPYLLQPENFNPYYAAYTALTEQKIYTVYSATMESIIGEDYYAVFLSPYSYGNPQGSAYDKINDSVEPDSDDINNVSPIIYLEYKGVRFIFTGDAGFSQEAIAINKINLKTINKSLANKGKNAINLTDIDFLKVSHHGSSDASGTEFLQRITPKNAIVSVGGNNYGHPTNETLSRILAASESCNLYATGVDGTVSVFVDGNGLATVKTAKAA